jgi:hypothetical protein
VGSVVTGEGALVVDVVTNENRSEHGQEEVVMFDFCELSPTLTNVKCLQIVSSIFLTFDK